MRHKALDRVEEFFASYEWRDPGDYEEAMRLLDFADETMDDDEFMCHEVPKAASAFKWTGCKCPMPSWAHRAFESNAIQLYFTSAEGEPDLLIDDRRVLLGSWIVRRDDGTLDWYEDDDGFFADYVLDGGGSGARSL